VTLLQVRQIDLARDFECFRPINHMTLSLVAVPAFSSQLFVATLLEKADIHINGVRPWDMRLNAHGVIE